MLATGSIMYKTIKYEGETSVLKFILLKGQGVTEQKCNIERRTNYDPYEQVCN